MSNWTLEYEPMTPADMYLYDEVFKRDCAEDSMRDNPCFTVYSEMSALRAIQNVVTSQSPENNDIGEVING
jgi:hypothetical protein